MPDKHIKERELPTIEPPDEEAPELPEKLVPSPADEAQPSPALVARLLEMREAIRRRMKR